jgi:hypothetical protein
LSGRCSYLLRPFPLDHPAELRTDLSDDVEDELVRLDRLGREGLQEADHLGANPDGEGEARF